MLHKIGVKLKFRPRLPGQVSGPWVSTLTSLATPSYNFPPACPELPVLVLATISLYPFITRVRSQRLSKSRTSSSEIQQIKFCSESMLEMVDRDFFVVLDPHDNPHSCGMWPCDRAKVTFRWLNEKYELRICPIIFFSASFVLKTLPPNYSPWPVTASNQS